MEYRESFPFAPDSFSPNFRAGDAATRDTARSILTGGNQHRTMLKTTLRTVLAVFFVAAGGMHFLHPAAYLPFMPPLLPWPLGLIYLMILARRYEKD